MGSSVLMHDLVKFADTGLQLRLPVDLIPSGQYGQLSNAIPRIEGILETREGATPIAEFNNPATVGFQITDLARSVATGTFADTVYTATPTTFAVGQTILLTVTNGLGNFAVGAITTVITGINPSLNQMFIAPPVSAPGFTSGGAGLIASCVGTVNSIGNLQTFFLHTIHRLNQSVLSLTGERIVGSGVNLFAAPLPAGNLFTQLAVFLSGNPLSIVDFRFTLDTATWAVFTDGVTQYKYRSPYLFLLGNPPATVPTIANVGPAGNLNSTGGSNYDWRYTYFDGYVETEGNPSPSPDSGTIEVKASTSQTNPNPARNFPSGTNVAFTGVTNTSGLGTNTQSATSFNQASCIWKGFANPATTPFIITLNVSWQASITKPDVAPIQCQINLTTNNGATWTLLDSVTNASSGARNPTVNLPLGTDLTQVRVEAYGFCNSHGAGGGTFIPGGSFTLTVTNIEIDCNLSPTPNTLALVNQQALVCVSPPASNDGRITAIRLYRRGGSLPDNWRRVGTFALSGLVQGSCGSGKLLITDNVGDTTLSTQAILELDNDQPVSSVSVINQSLTFFWGPAGIEARVLGVGDPGRPECVYFCKPGNPDAWAPNDFVEVSSPGERMISGCIWNTRNFAFSNEGIFELVEGLSSTAVFTPFPTPSTHGLISPWGLVSATAMYFVAKDGIYESTGGQEVSIVENDIKPLFPTYDGPGQSIEGYEAVDMTDVNAIRLRYHNNELYFIYTGLASGTRQELVYDTLKKRWRAVNYTSAMATVYSEPGTVSSLLLGTVAGGLYQSLGNRDPNELDVIFNVRMSTNVTATAITPGNYFAVVTRSDSSGQVAKSPEFGPFTLNGTTALRIIFPPGPAGTQSWNIYYGITQGGETRMRTVSEFALPPTRIFDVIDMGSAGTPPIFPPNTDIAVTIRTGAHDQGAPLNRKQYSNVIFDLDAQANQVTITPFIDGETQNEFAITTTSLRRTQIPLDLSDFFAFNVEYQIQWSSSGPAPLLYQYDTLYYNEPVATRHWLMKPSSFGEAGYLHIRDLYLAVRSTADITLSLVLDETSTQFYTIPSTGGKRQKVYIQLNSNKAKEYRIILDSEEEFRLYDEDMEVRIKGWLTVLGYANVRPLGVEQHA